MSDNVNFVRKSNLCCSCGLCSNYCKHQAITYKINRLGFYEPIVDDKKCTHCKECIRYCPGINDLKNYDQENPQYFFGYSTDEEMHLNASSGGIATELLCYLISQKIVDYVTCVTQRTENSLPEQIITNDISTIKKARTSKYCPIKWNNIIRQIENLDGTIAIVALPCQINSIKRYFNKRKSKNKIKFYISLLCNHTPSLKAAEFITQSYSKKAKLKSLVNRGGGFPGYMTYQVKERDRLISFQTPFRKTWGKGYGLYFKNMRCILCNDPFAKNADLTMGDSYFLQETDTKGTTFCIVRNPTLRNILTDMREKGVIILNEGPDIPTIKKYYKILFDRENDFLIKNKCLQVLHKTTIVTPDIDKVSLRYVTGFYKNLYISQIGKYKWLWPILIKRNQVKNIITNIKNETSQNNR